MHSAVLLTVVVTLVGVNGQRPGPSYQPPTTQGGYLPPSPSPETIVVNEFVTVTDYDTKYYTVQATRTQDVRLTETLSTAVTYTADVTTYQKISGGYPGTRTVYVHASSQALVLSTVQSEAPHQTYLSVESTRFITSTLIEDVTLRVTHIDNVLEQTVVPVYTSVYVDQVETTTVTRTITYKVTSTIRQPEPLVNIYPRPAPVYPEEPVYTPAPVYPEEPVYTPAPVYPQEPVYAPRRGYGQ